MSVLEQMKIERAIKAQEGYSKAFVNIMQRAEEEECLRAHYEKEHEKAESWTMREVFWASEKMHEGQKEAYLRSLFFVWLYTLFDD